MVPTQTCYKYRAINDYLMETLEKGTIYFAQRDELNDPYDCNISMPKAVHRMMTYCNDVKKLEVLFNLMPDNGQWTNVDSMISRMGIATFSQTLNETLMWAHYADNHKGVALIFNFPATWYANRRNFTIAGNVVYKDNPISDWLIDEVSVDEKYHRLFLLHVIDRLLLSKAPAWHYEQEFRIISPKVGAYEFPKDSLKGVYFGLNTPDDDEKMIREIVEKNYTNVTFGRIQRTIDDYGIV